MPKTVVEHVLVGLFLGLVSAGSWWVTILAFLIRSEADRIVRRSEEFTDDQPYLSSHDNGFDTQEVQHSGSCRRARRSLGMASHVMLMCQSSGGLDSLDVLVPQ